jgi:type III secretion system IpaD/SipD/SspD family effector
MFGFLDFLNPPDAPDSREDKIEDGGEPMINPHDKDASGLVWNSHSEFYEQVGQLLAALQQNWLSKYQDAMKVFLEFYEEFSDALDKIQHGTSGYDNEVLVTFKEMRDALNAMLAKYKLDDNAMASFGTRAEADAFIKSLGLPGLKVSPETGTPADGKYRVMIDLSSVEDIVKSLDGVGDGQQRWDVARYNAWLSKKDGNVEDIKHTSKVLGEKLNEMTQKFDNIVKILSSTIDKITEADMSFVRGI